MVTNLTAPHKVEGVNKLLISSDITSLKHKQNVDTARKFEQSLARCQEMVEELLLSCGPADHQHYKNQYMFLPIRGVAHLCSKGI